jgi:GGDEF domain-containing protein
MPVPSLRVLLAEKGFTETGLTLRALCTETGRSVELYYVWKSGNVGEALRKYSPDVALLDLALFQPDPPAAVSVLHRSSPEIPLILFANPADKESATQCLQSGAKDFMLEGYMDARTLGRVLHAAIGGNQAGPVASCARDPVTGLLSRSGLFEQAEQIFEPSPFPNARLLVSVRLLNLESIRKDRGEPGVDQLLQELGRILRGSVRQTDVVTHVASGHFVLFVMEAGKTYVGAVRQRIAKRLGSLDQSERTGVPLLFSVRCDCWPADSLEDFRAFLQEQSSQGASVPKSLSAP